MNSYMESLKKAGDGIKWDERMECLRMARLMKECALLCARNGFSGTDLKELAVWFNEDSKHWRIEYERLSC